MIKRYISVSPETIDRKTMRASGIDSVTHRVYPAWAPPLHFIDFDIQCASAFRANLLVLTATWYFHPYIYIATSDCSISGFGWQIEHCIKKWNTRTVYYCVWCVVFFLSFSIKRKRERKESEKEWMRRWCRVAFSVEIVAPGQMSHGDKGLTTRWRKIHRTCAPVRRVNPKIHYCSAHRDCS